MKTKFFVFDNEGETFDRYTIIDSEGEMLGLSENPNSPTGFNQYAGNCVDNYMFTSFGYSWRRHCDVKKVIKGTLPKIISSFEQEGNIGKRIKFSQLPKQVQLAALHRFEQVTP